MKILSRKRFIVKSGLAILVLFCAYNFSSLKAQEEIDPYLWMEDIEGEEQMEWVEKHNNISLEYLKGIPGFQERYDFAYEIFTSDKKLIYPRIHGEYVYNFWQDEKHSRGIYRRILLEDYLNKSYKWEAVLDIDELSLMDSVNWVLKGVYFAPGNSQRCLVDLSPGGSDASVVREFDVSNMSFIEDGFNLDQAKSNISWINENTIYVATNYGESSLTESGYPRMIKRWKRGDRLDEAEIVLEAKVSDLTVSPLVVNTFENQYEFIIKSSDFYHQTAYYISNAQLYELNLPDDFTFDILDKQLVVVPFNEWILGEDTIHSGTVISLDLMNFANGKYDYQVLHQTHDRGSIESIAATSNCLLINTLNNIKSELFRYTYADNIWEGEKVDLPSSGTIEIIEADNLVSSYFISYESFMQPTSIYFDKSDGTKPDLVMNLPENFDRETLAVDQYEAVSKDGTRIPYFILHPKNMEYDGDNPTILYGYGGFQVSEKPFYSATVGNLWVEKGGVYVVANIRGGGEFGAEWHNSAIKENKQKSYDDFIAVAEDLHRRKITSADKLGISGGSNGGLLVGAVMTQRPDLFKAVICYVPLLDMKRYTKLLAGKSWEAEYGNPDIPEEWEYIKKYSPYQNVFPEKDYPTIIFLTSTRDDRVHPGHARKMAAKMEEMGHNIYLFENTEGGHAASYTPEHRSRLTAINYSFFIDQLMN